MLKKTFNCKCFFLVNVLSKVRFNSFLIIFSITAKEEVNSFHYFYFYSYYVGRMTKYNVHTATRAYCAIRSLAGNWKLVDATSLNLAIFDLSTENEIFDKLRRSLGEVLKGTPALETYATLNHILLTNRTFAQFSFQMVSYFLLHNFSGFQRQVQIWTELIGETMEDTSGFISSLYSTFDGTLNSSIVAQAIKYINF